MKKEMFQKLNILKKTTLLLCTLFLFSFAFAFSQTAEEIKKQISQQDSKIAQIEKAIKESEAKIKKYSGQSQLLKKEIAKLDLLKNQLQKAIYQKEKSIKNLKNTINAISKNISSEKEKIIKLKEELKKSIFFIYQKENTSRFETILSGASISEIARDLTVRERIVEVLEKNISEIIKTKADLENNKKQKEKETQKLNEEKESLADKKYVLESNKKQKDKLLKETKNKETNYKKLLAEQKKVRQQVQQEIAKLESRLKFVADKNTIPKPQVGLFSWPTRPWPSKVHIITQFFGLTTFREVYYNGKGHNGIDVGVPIGSGLYSAMSGVVKATGDNTKSCKGVQYGRWVVVDHQNGLSTLYAHMERIDVKPGQRVSRGQKIGLSGNTGYSTGPHLHFTVFYTKGLKIQTISHRYKGRCYGAKMTVPIASHKAYTDPFDYLPKPEFNLILKPVSFGQKGKAVKNLQNMLKYEKVFPRNISANGMFGSTTEKSLKRWKEKYKISGDGKSFSASDLQKFKAKY
ncbi:hypothetical protein CSB11_01695 [Candidatus Campbellbacteria bacterium]|nr:MAG: hypothetical protein CSB11_01695 [Candidatus Campbellbacteria bacterium]